MVKDLIVPDLGESITEAVVTTWLKQVGDVLAEDEPVVDLETDKVSVQIPAPTAGVLKAQKFAEGDTVKVGEVVGLIEPGGASATATVTSTAALPKTPSPVAAKPATQPQATPRTAGASAQHGTPAQRRAQREGGTSKRVSSAVFTSAVTPASGEREETVRMTPLRKTIARRLVEAQQTAAILTTFNEVDMSRVIALRKEHQEDFVAKHGIKLGFMSFFVKAAIESLREFPGLNAEVRGDDIVYKKHYDIGIAVGSGKGLVVPVVRDADSLSFGGIEQRIRELGKKAVDGRLALADLQGGTFTVSNGGVYGSMMSTPLLNMPQTGILGLHNIVKRAVVIDDEIEIRPMMYLALSYDHRVADGREAVRFLIGIKKRIEAPDRMLFSL